MEDSAYRMASARNFKADTKNNELSVVLELLPWEYVKLNWLKEEFPVLYGRIDYWAKLFGLPVYVIWVLLRELMQWSNGFARFEYPHLDAAERRNSILGLYGFPGIGKSFLKDILSEVTERASYKNRSWREKIGHEFLPSEEKPVIIEPATFDDMVSGIYERGGLGIVIFEEQS